MTTTEIILAADEISDILDALDSLIGATDPGHQELLRQKYAPGSEARGRVLCLVDRLISARDLRAELES